MAVCKSVFQQATGSGLPNVAIISSKSHVTSRQGEIHPREKFCGTRAFHLGLKTEKITTDIRTLVLNI